MLVAAGISTFGHLPKDSLRFVARDLENSAPALALAHNPALAPAPAPTPARAP